MKSFFKFREDGQFCCEECVDDSVYGSVEENFEVTGDEQYEDWDLDENLTGYSTSNVSTQRDPKTYQTRELGKLGYTKRNVKTRSTVGGSGGYSLATRQHSMVSNNTLVKRSPLNQSADVSNDAPVIAEEMIAEEMHRVSVTVVDPNHTMVSMRKEAIQKTVRVKALDKDNAIHKATQYYKDRGYKVKDHNYVGLAEAKQTWPGHSDTVKNPNFNDELTARRIGPIGRRLKSGKISADELGQQDRLKKLMKFTKVGGGLTGPKGPLPEEQGVAEGAINDYFKRRKDEEDRIAGTKAPAKRTPRQTDYEKKRKEQGVAEGSLDEISKALATGYMYSAMADRSARDEKISKAIDTNRKTFSSIRHKNITKMMDKNMKRSTGIMGAIDRVQKEEVVNELSSGTLQNYKEKAKVSADNLTAKGEHGKSADRWLNVMKATGKQIDKTTAGIKKALNKEEVEEIDELNKDTLYSYSNKANKDITKRHKELGAQIRADKSVEANKNSMKISNRDKGLDRAETRLNKEGITEAYGRRDAYTRDYQSSVSGMGKRQSAAYHADGGANDEGWGNETSKYKPADHPHSVHINGKKWKTFTSQSHAQNVSNKIKGATVQRENG